MKYMTLEYIKKHSRIDFDCEDDLLQVYAESAEATVENLCNRDYDEFVETYGAMPAPVIHATLMMVDHSYLQRSPVSPVHLSVVPYGVDALLLPYVKLTTDEEED